MINGIGNMHVNNFAKTRIIKSYGKYAVWPLGVSGMYRVVNLQTGENCVHLSMIAHFCFKKALKMHNLSRQARFHRNRIDKYHIFLKMFQNLYLWMTLTK